MKKTISAILAIVMLISSVCMSALADVLTITDKSGYNVADIPVKEKAKGTNIYEAVDYEEDAARVCVTVSWGELSFTYDFGGEWNPETLTYERIPGWEKAENIVTVTNRSNCDVEVFIEFEKYDNDIYKNVEMTFNKDSVVLESAHDRTEDELDSFDFSLKAEGMPSKYVPTGEFGYVVVYIGATDVVVEPPVTPPPLMKTRTASMCATSYTISSDASSAPAATKSSMSTASTWMKTVSATSAASSATSARIATWAAPANAPD